ncbi:septum formation inhibitor Maf [bacterium endosymbiont of Escarpia laminata]|nr:MAG: septum formation inhibitor Maf [bacterium endosymbiont of Escarpia laminata]RLJ17535.1 MAG: septum formation inhibitor Maf [bacterium endosymbiont of Escarpia laminata]
MASATRTLVLGSTSPFRRELLNRLGIAFETASPEIDETPVPDEAPEALVTRLARLKAEAVRESWPNALIIGSDQVATIDGEILGKPGSHERAVEQLSKAAGKRVTFSTGLCLLNSRTGNTQVCCEPFHVYFRQLEQQAIEHYLQREQPYNCAGSFKSEGLGITLFEKMEGDDPNSLIGLPLIRLVDMLANEGWDILGNA